MSISTEEYLKYDATGLAELVKQKQVTADELLDSAISIAEQWNPKINAINTPLHDYGRDLIKKSDPNAPLYGVPFLVKDLCTQLAGTPYSAGSNALKNYVSDHDSELGKRFKDAGLIIFGKTNTPEMGLMGTTEPEAFGPTHNPWKLNTSSGGSSGGSGAAVAAGIVPMASGGDGGGSIRIPSSACGLFGLKPSRYRVTAGPDFADFWDGAATEHVLAKSVRDSALMLDIINGPMAGEPAPIEKADGFLSAMNERSSKLKIAYSTDSPIGTPVSESAKQAIAHSVKLLQNLGHEVVEAKPIIDGHALAKCYLTMYFGHVAADLMDMSALTGVHWKKLNVEMPTKTLGRFGMALPAGEFVKAKRLWNSFARTMGQFFQQYDVYLTPTLADDPQPHGTFAPSTADVLSMHLVNALGLHKLTTKTNIIEEMAYKSLEKVPYTQLANLTGIPAMSVPLYWSESGLPMGSQFMAPMGADKRLISLAAQLEQAQPWFDKRPSAPI